MKNILETIGVSLSRAVEHVVDKNRKAAQINRLKLVIRNEERVAEKAYAALGKILLSSSSRCLRCGYRASLRRHRPGIQKDGQGLTRLEELCAQPACQEEDCASCSGYDCSGCSGCGDDFEDDDFSDEMPISPDDAPFAEEEPDLSEEEAAPAKEPAPVENEEASPAEEDDAVYCQAEPELPVQPPVDCASREVADSRDNRDIPFI